MGTRRPAVIELGNEPIQDVDVNPARSADTHRAEFAAGHQVVDIGATYPQPGDNLKDRQQQHGHGLVV